MCARAYARIGRTRSYSSSSSCPTDAVRTPLLLVDDGCTKKRRLVLRGQQTCTSAHTTAPSLMNVNPSMSFVRHNGETSCASADNAGMYTNHTSMPAPKCVTNTALSCSPRLYACERAVRTCLPCASFYGCAHGDDKHRRVHTSQHKYCVTRPCGIDVGQFVHVHLHVQGLHGQVCVRAHRVANGQCHVRAERNSTGYCVLASCTPLVVDTVCQ